MTEVIHVPRCLLAEGEGFEPPVPFRVQWFSRPPPSTTRPSLRVVIIAAFSDRLAVVPLSAGLAARTDRAVHWPWWTAAASRSARSGRAQRQLKHRRSFRHCALHLMTIRTIGPRDAVERMHVNLESHQPFDVLQVDLGRSDAAAGSNFRVLVPAELRQGASQVAALRFVRTPRNSVVGLRFAVAR